MHPNFEVLEDRIAFAVDAITSPLPDAATTQVLPSSMLTGSSQTMPVNPQVTATDGGSISSDAMTGAQSFQQFVLGSPELLTIAAANNSMILVAGPTDFGIFAASGTLVASGLTNTLLSDSTLSSLNAGGLLVFAVGGQPGLISALNGVGEFDSGTVLTDASGNSYTLLYQGNIQDLNLSGIVQSVQSLSNFRVIQNTTQVTNLTSPISALDVSSIQFTGNSGELIRSGADSINVSVAPMPGQPEIPSTSGRRSAAASSLVQPTTSAVPLEIPITSVAKGVNNVVESVFQIANKTVRTGSLGAGDLLREALPLPVEMSLRILESTARPTSEIERSKFPSDVLDDEFDISRLREDETATDLAFDDSLEGALALGLSPLQFAWLSISAKALSKRRDLKSVEQ